MIHEPPRSFTRKSYDGSDRAFGLVMAAACAVVGLAPLAKSEPVRPAALVLGAAFLAAALLRPMALSAANRAWGRLGFALQRITTPVVMSVVFVTVILPIGVVIRLLRIDPLRLRVERGGTGSYWITRQPPGPAPASLKQQF